MTALINDELSAIRERDAAMKRLEGAPQFYWDRRRLLELYDALAKEIEYLREALGVIAVGTICPELFPDAPRTDEDYELAAKTAMVTAIAALEHKALAPALPDEQGVKP